MSSVELMNEKERAKVMEGLEKKESDLRSLVRQVVQGYVNSAFIWGPGGLGKTHVVTTELGFLSGSGWQHHTAYATPKALMMALAEFPNAVHLFEDCESLYKAEAAASILRAACGSPKQSVRWVHYETAHEKLAVAFTGGIIIVSNENLARAKGALAAVASRFRPVQWNLTTQERIAKILTIAEQGWRRGDWILTPAQCKQVAKFLVEEMVQGEVQVPVDLRTFTEHALPAFAQSLDKTIKTDWKQLIRTKLQGEVNRVERRDERGDRLEQIAYAIWCDKSLAGKAKIEAWTERTSLAKSIYYRHLAQAKASAPRVQKPGK